MAVHILNRTRKGRAHLRFLTGKPDFGWTECQLYHEVDRPRLATRRKDVTCKYCLAEIDLRGLTGPTEKGIPE